MIEVRYRDRLGNNLFQYCLGRILAEEFGWELRTNPLRGFPNTAQKVGGAAYAAPEEVLVGQQIDFAGVLANRTPRKIIADGWFQRYEYFRPYREQVRKWLQFDPTIELPDNRPDVVIHVRRTDYVPRWALPFSFYEAALEQMSAKIENVWITTDNPEDPFLNKFDRWRPQVFHRGVLADFAFMASARRLIISQSTYSWWATFLGDQEQVICPVPSHGPWSDELGVQGVNLIEYDRFHCIECNEPYIPTRQEARYYWWRRFKRRMVNRVNMHLGTKLPLPPH